MLAIDAMTAEAMLGSPESSEFAYTTDDLLQQTNTLLQSMAVDRSVTPEDDAVFFSEDGGRIPSPGLQADTPQQPAGRLQD